ncbi:hypothetical protein ACWGKQ_02680 [Streptomyces sp. NPDC054770]
MSCTRLTRAQRPCRHEITDWPAYDRMPVPVAACWQHLTDDEREKCKAARARRNAEIRERFEQMRAELLARGETAPEQALREARPCTGKCITLADQWDRDNPGRSYDHSDSAVVSCARCDEHVCILCTARDHCVGTPCTSPGAVPDDDFSPARDKIDLGPTPRAYLNTLVGQLARVTGQPHPTVNVRINQEIGVYSRVGADDAVIRRAVVVARDWLAAEEQSSPATHHSRPSA